MNQQNTDQAMMEMPKYNCHKQVWALKIKHIKSDATGYYIHPEDERYAPIQVDRDFVMKHEPKAGGYYVVYKGGYASFSPADAFEGGYSQVEAFTHGDMVKQLAKPGETIAEELTGADAHAVHMVLGISGEAGELLDAVKKSVIYRKPLDLDNVVEELGDLEFYLEGLRQGLGITREQTLQANISKLGKRYQGHQYSDQQAQDRADKASDVEDEHRVT